MRLGCKYVPVILSLILIDYVYAYLHTKSPDSQFIPRTIQIPPAMPQPGTATPTYPGLHYPTIVFEVSHTNEKWPQLIHDARTKTFSRDTTIQVWVGLKIFPEHLRAVWGKRGARGHGMKMMRVTRKFRIDRPTRLKFQIPASLIFWGCPAIPPHITSPFCEIAFEEFRRDLQPLIH